MPNDFHLMVLEIPEEITLEYIELITEKALSLDLNSARVLSEFIDYDIDEIDLSDNLEEDDLFDIGGDNIKVKYAARNHLVDSINYVLSPRVGLSGRAGIDISPANIKYICIGDKTYAAAGYETSYSSKKPSRAYSYLVALNISSIM